MHPPPSPKGSASKAIHQIFGAKEKPKSAEAVRQVHTAVTAGVPKRFIILAEKKLIIMEPQVQVMVTAGAIDTDMPKSSYTAGQTEPKTASGTPSPITAAYITTSKSVAITKSLLYAFKIPLIIAQSLLFFKPVN